jgi:flavin reductase (DIM6/NTAB) family NADH-FMN oxidoreductase RutF
MVAGLVGPLTDLGEHLASVPGARFVVHVLGSGHRRLAEHFAGDVPAPEEMLATATSAFGPLLRAVPDRLFCRTVSTRDFGYSLLVEAEVADADVATSGPGLAWYRGSFWPLGR